MTSDRRKDVRSGAYLLSFAENKIPVQEAASELREARVKWIRSTFLKIR
jgi:hypothetical protein